MLGQIGSYPIYPETRENTKPEKMITEMNAEFNKFTNLTSSNDIASLEAQAFTVDLCYGPNGLIRNVLIHGGNYWAEKKGYYEDLCK